MNTFMQHTVIFPDQTQVTIKDRRFFSNAVVIKDYTGKWFVWSMHSNRSLAQKKVIECKNTFSLRGEKSVDWFSATVVTVR